jgi:hypothetical protein
MKRSTGFRGTYLDWPLKRAGTGLPQIHSAAVSMATWLRLAACPMPTQHVVVVRPYSWMLSTTSAQLREIGCSSYVPSPRSQLRRGEWPSKRTQPLLTAAASILHKDPSNGRSDCCSARASRIASVQPSINNSPGP